MLKPGGKLALQAITIADERLNLYEHNVDFIQKYIFPGGFLPSTDLLSRHICNDTDMVILSIFEFGSSYASTLKAWRERLTKNQTELQDMGYDINLFRLWNYYLAYCEAGFLEKKINVVQLIAEKAERQNRGRLPLRK